jgi:hypothetical protein
MNKLFKAGRVCPVDYHYSPAALDRPAELEAEVLYVVGGLYGNGEALQAIESLTKREHTQPVIIFNGDFHILDAEPDWFREIERRVAIHQAIRGNVETEISRAEDIGAGCGCAYPKSVSDDLVRRSNEIVAELHRIAASVTGAADRLSRLPMHLVAQVQHLRIGIVHGDATALAGWGFGCVALDDPSKQQWLADIAQDSHINVFASTHTGLAVLRDFTFPSGKLTIINNGSAGLPSFTGKRFGVISRISARPSPHLPLYGIERDGIYIDAIAVRYDHVAFLSRFLKRWPEGSAAHASYFSRINSGPDYTIDQAKPR